MTTPATPMKSSPVPISIGLRQSNVTSATAAVAEADGDTWQEKIAVCETSTAEGNPRMQIRSYYRSIRTGERVWDEPPSGASCIIYATPDMRRTAQLQMDELQLTLEMIPPDDISPDNATSSSNVRNEAKTKKGFLGGMFRKKDRKYVEPSKDLNLQRAIARSMRDQGATSSNEYDDAQIRSQTSNTDDDDAEMEFAKALSLSEFDSSDLKQLEARCTYPKDDAEEAALLRRVIEESQRDMEHANKSN